jgi:transcriptional regulator of heat shock response
MSNLGKRILSAFVEVSDDKKKDAEKPAEPTTHHSTPTLPVSNSYTVPVNPSASSKFKDYFDKLFKEANIPGPDYFEFSKMVEVMQSIADEKLRYTTAFAGLNVQGLDKPKLLSTAEQYLQVLDTDAANFHSSVDAALQEKVHEKKRLMEEKSQRIAQLTQEISTLQNEQVVLQNEIKENEEKIEANTGGYKYESEVMKNRIVADIEKIKRFIP